MVTVPSWDAFAQLTALADRLRGQIGHVATRYEGAIIAAAFIRQRMGLAGQTLDEAIGFVDKSVMKTRLRRAGIPVAGHQVVTRVGDAATVAKTLGWPLVLKPRKGFASVNTHIVASKQELAEYEADGIFTRPVPASPFYRGEPAFAGLAHQPDGIVVEQYLQIAEEYHIDGLWLGGKPVYQIPGLYHLPPLKGMSSPLLGSVLLESTYGVGAFLADLATRAGTVLGMRTGFTHTEVMRTVDDRWYVGEIAARPGGGGIQQAIGFAYGIDVPTIHAQLACGAQPQVRLDPRPGYVGWCGPAVPSGRVVHVASREQLVAYPGVLDATVAIAPGQMGGPTGSGLWGGLAGYTWLHGDSAAHVLSTMGAAAARYQVGVLRPVAGARS
ncbi:hypothetical protein Rhe02_09530 [Rhizocola hellebori]|uniref:ATP-grasp domain-containing protein n=2 Tax=Rhizocola hellebori TaxID=1392758 RepID=A0A8J3Q3U0_9ACTN|nr:hypothetical protein Rhe02_09530 [Rhizocola hellebori]